MCRLLWRIFIVRRDQTIRSNSRSTVADARRHVRQFTVNLRQFTHVVTSLRALYTDARSVTLKRIRRCTRAHDCQS